MHVQRTLQTECNMRHMVSFLAKHLLSDLATVTDGSYV